MRSRVHYTIPNGVQGGPVKGEAIYTDKKPDGDWTIFFCEGNSKLRIPTEWIDKETKL